MAVSQVRDSVCADSEPQQAYVAFKRPLMDDAAAVLVVRACRSWSSSQTIVEQHFALSSEA
jgi:hypothetical protein